MLILARRSHVGGACVTEQTWPGFHSNTYAYAAGLLRPERVHDLSLPQFGLKTILFDPQMFQPFPDGRAPGAWVDPKRTAKGLEAFLHHDAVAYPRYLKFWDHIVEPLDPILLGTAAPLDQLVKLVPGEEGDWLLRDLILRSARDAPDEWFESDELKGTLAINAVIGTFLSPSSPGSAYVLAHLSFENLDGHREVWGFAVGGMGSTTQALHRVDEHAGVTIATGVEVRRLLVHEGRAVGVETASGEKITVRAVASSIDARQTFLHLAPPEALPTDFLERVGKIRYRAAQVKFNAALDSLPGFFAARGTPSDAHRGALEISPSPD